MAEVDTTIAVEVAYAAPDRQLIVPLQVGMGADVASAVQQSGILTRFPEIDLESNAVGIFGKVCTLQQNLRAGDRIEIYRPLLADPKDSRRQRADRKQQKTSTRPA